MKNNFQLTKKSFGSVAKNSGNLLSILNPLGFISDTVVSILDYKQKIAEIEYQKLQVKEQSKIMMEKISTIKEISLRNLQIQEYAIQESLQLACEELSNARIERSRIMDTVCNLNNALMDNNTSIQEKQIYAQSSEILLNSFVESDKNSVNKFKLTCDNLTQNLSLANPQNQFKLN